MQIKPYAYGLRQRAGQALGFIFEDVLGKPDGQFRGTIVGPQLTNKFLNPVFGHATWDTSWTAGTNMVASKNTDMRFVLWGKVSAKLTNADTSVPRLFTAQINVGNTSTHTRSFYVKRVDSAAVTSADCQVYYGAGQVTTFTAVGDGWYRADWSGAGVNAATASGVTVKAGRVIYVTSFQLEQTLNPRPLVYGDDDSPEIMNLHGLPFSVSV